MLFGLLVIIWKNTAAAESENSSLASKSLYKRLTPFGVKPSLMASRQIIELLINNQYIYLLASVYLHSVDRDHAKIGVTVIDHLIFS